MKKQIASDMISVISPIRSRIDEIKSNDKYIREVVGDGASKARASANATLKDVREIMGIKSF